MCFLMSIGFWIVKTKRLNAILIHTIIEMISYRSIGRQNIELPKMSWPSVVGEIVCNDPVTFQFIEEKDILKTEILS